MDIILEILVAVTGKNYNLNDYDNLYEDKYQFRSSTDGVIIGSVIALIHESTTDLSQEKL